MIFNTDVHLVKSYNKIKQKKRVREVQGKLYDIWASTIGNVMKFNTSTPGTEVTKYKIESGGHLFFKIWYY